MKLGVPQNAVNFWIDTDGLQPGYMNKEECLLGPVMETSHSNPEGTKRFSVRK
jgi:hypothetical protein